MWRRAGHAQAGDRRRRRSRRIDARDRHRSLRYDSVAARRRRQVVERLTRDLFREADAGNMGPSRLRRRDRGQGRFVEGRQGALSASASSIRSTCCPRQAIAVLRSSTSSSITSKGCSTTTRACSRTLKCVSSTRSSPSPRPLPARASPSKRPTDATSSLRLRGRVRRIAIAGPGMLGLASRGQTFRDRFLIADIRMEADLPIERRFWFDPPFHPHARR